MRALFTVGLLTVTSILFAQQDTASPKAQYLAAQKIIGSQFSNYLNSNFSRLHSLPEKAFLFKIDSVRGLYNALLKRSEPQLDKSFVADERISIKYYFDRLIIDHPFYHDNYTGKTNPLSPTIQAIATKNIPDLNKPALLGNSDLRDYVRAFFHYQEAIATKKGLYRNIDNFHLQATWDFIGKYITNRECANYWKYDYLYDHLENDGIKNIEKIYRNFITTYRDTAGLNKIIALYREDSIGRLGHIIKTYKTVGPFKLDIHIFVPDAPADKKRPTIVYFHGGSWSEGKPDWFFGGCESLAKQGWVACAVEYRISDRHNTTPFQAVMDARSAIRWLRKNAQEYGIDTGRIVASGNSAGGHLVLATALADKWNEKTDDLSFSPVPNLLLVNSGVYDLADEGSAWMTRDLKDPTVVREISPNHLVRKNLPPMLLLHGTKDRSVPFVTAKTFEQQMKAAGNNFEFHAIEDAPHYIWYVPPFSTEVSALRADFLKKFGY